MLVLNFVMDVIHLLKRISIVMKMNPLIMKMTTMMAIVKYVRKYMLYLYIIAIYLISLHLFLTLAINSEKSYSDSLKEIPSLNADLSTTSNVIL
jgi:hypothetical protein